MDRTAPPDAEARLRVLVVEDDASIRDIVVQGLAAEGHDARGASDGWRGLEIAAQTPPDVIVLDIRMPEMDGHEFARLYREAGGNAPIVVLTAHSEPGAAHERIAPARVLRKPFDLDELLATVASVGAPGLRPAAEG